MIALSARDMPEQVLILFWDVDLATLDLEDHKKQQQKLLLDGYCARGNR